MMDILGKLEVIEQIKGALLYTPFGVVRIVRLYTAPKPPFTQGSIGRCRMITKKSVPMNFS